MNGYIHNNIYILLSFFLFLFLLSFSVCGVLPIELSCTAYYINYTTPSTLHMQVCVVTTSEKLILF